MAKEIIHGVHFRVPNNKKGKTFINGLRLYANRERIGEIVARTRGPRPSGDNTQADKDTCTGFAVYLRESKALRKQEYEAQQKSHDGCMPLFRHRALVQELVTTATSAENALTQQLAEQELRTMHYKVSANYWTYAALVLGTITLVESLYLVLR